MKEKPLYKTYTVTRADGTTVDPDRVFVLEYEKGYDWEVALMLRDLISGASCDIADALGKDLTRYQWENAEPVEPTHGVFYDNSHIDSNRPDQVAKELRVWGVTKFDRYCIYLARPIPLALLDANDWLRQCNAKIDAKNDLPPVVLEKINEINNAIKDVIGRFDRNTAERPTDEWMNECEGVFAELLAWESLD